MKYQLLLLWTLAAFVSCQVEKKIEIKMDDIPDGVKLSCTEGKQIFKDQIEEAKDEIVLLYRDDNTGEYTCTTSASDGQTAGPKIFVKYRTCDNCVELDMSSIAGIAVGDVVATVVVGVAVYLIALKARSGPVPSNKKRSDRKPLVANEGYSRSTSTEYQPLRLNQRRDEYDVLRQ
ncbi:T-cell surface glycoprotein CD3 delta chain isoform 2-T2 [Odontesthes bonariensis]